MHTGSKADKTEIKIYEFITKVLNGIGLKNSNE